MIKFAANEQTTLLRGRGVTRVVTYEARARVVEALVAVVVRGVIWREIETAAVIGTATGPETVEQICVSATNVANIIGLLVI